MPAISKKRLFIAISMLVLIITASVSAYYFFRSEKNPKKGNSQTSPKFEAFWQERIEAAMKETACSFTDQPKISATFYQGKLIDGHIHIPSIFAGQKNDTPGEEDTLVHSTLGLNLTMNEFVCTLKHDGTNQAIAFFPVYREIIGPHLEIVKRTVVAYPNQFIPFNMPPDNDGSPTGYPTVEAATLEKMLSVYPNLFQGYGEIGLYVREGGAPALPPDSQRLRDIYPVVRKHKLAIYFHLGEGQREAYKKAIKEKPDINFIFHGDQLIKQEGEKQDLSQIEDILSSAPNVYYEVDELWGDVWLLRDGVSKEQFFDHFKDYEPLIQKDLATWKAFIEKYQDQVIWGSDRGIFRWTVDLDVGRQLTDYVRAFIARLDPAVQEKYAYKNIEKIFKD